MAQVEGILSLLPGGKKLVALEVSSPTLVAGAVTVTLESVNKIDYVIGSIRDPDNADTKWISMSYAVGEAANTIDVTFQVGSTTEWADAETTDVADKIVSFLVIGA
jgi:hypothetical protein